jgi:hypothetical protein
VIDLIIPGIRSPDFTGLTSADLEEFTGESIILTGMVETVEFGSDTKTSTNYRSTFCQMEQV